MYRELCEASTECARIQAQADAKCEPLLVWVVEPLGISRWRVGASEAEAPAEDHAHPVRSRRARVQARGIA